ncbi:MAG: ATP-binding protein [bacterium]|nr:ATP-binding protein [bacterium]
MAINIILLIIIIISVFRLYRRDQLIKDLNISLRKYKADVKEKIRTEDLGQAKLETVLSSMFEGVLVVDKKREIILMNPSLKKKFVVDSPPEGKRPLEVIRNSLVHDIIDNTLSGKFMISKEITLTYPEKKVLEINGEPIIINNILEGAVLVFHDITELRRLEDLRQDFVANVSHELRTPIASIKGYTETLLDGAIEDKNNAKDFLRIIHEDSDRLAKLIDDLLDLSRIESGRMKMVFAPVEPGSLIKRSTAIIENQAKARSISIEINIPGNIPKILADETRLSQVLINLLDNAVKYTPEGGSVIITGFVNKNFLQINITDTGIGIPEEDLPRLFERFYRVDKARSREMGGTGLGLSIVKHIVQAHGGEVFVRSDLGQGSTFSFTIPLA